MLREFECSSVLTLTGQWSAIEDLGETRVAVSSIPGAGLGLFAKRPFREGDLICTYFGRLLSTSQAMRLENKTYLMRLGPDMYLDASSSMCCSGRYINDCRNRLGYNAHFVKFPDRKIAEVRATCWIPEGAEVFVSYGRWYWGGQPAKRLRLCDLLKNQMQREEDDEQE